MGPTPSSLKYFQKQGMPQDVNDPLFEIALKAAGVDTGCNKSKDVVETVTSSKRCKWWNRGYCQKNLKCSYSHHEGDCQDHLKGGCTSKGCNTLRHRKQCRYLDSKSGGPRGAKYEYMHSVKEVSTKMKLEVAKRYIQTETNFDVKDKGRVKKKRRKE